MSPVANPMPRVSDLVSTLAECYQDEIGTEGAAPGRYPTPVSLARVTAHRLSAAKTRARYVTKPGVQPVSR